MFFKKTTCERCGEKISKNYKYCPFCGANLKDEEFNKFSLAEIKMPFPFNSLFDQLAKEFDKLFEDFETGGIRGKGISISISNETGVPVIKVGKIGKKKRVEVRKPAQRKVRKLAKEELEKYASLPREEAKTEVKRFSDKVVYEISAPDVESIENVFVNKLQNSIEIKAFGKNKVYFKLIPLDLKIKNYYLKDGKIILELKE